MQREREGLHVRDRSDLPAQDQLPGNVSEESSCPQDPGSEEQC